VNDQHDPGQLAAYAVGLLDDEDARATGAHVAGCPDCRRELAELREVDGVLRDVPPELFVDGPPPSGELVLQRTLRQVREESGVRRQQRCRRRRTLVAAAVAALVGIGAAGVALGRVTAGETITAEPVAGSRVLTGFNQATGARMTVAVTPQAGWVGIKATINGLPAGERCMLVVVDHGGHPFIVGSWVVPPPGGQGQEYNVNAGAAVAQSDVAAVKVQNFAGRALVVAPA
jgi:hypothetical protein